MPGTKKIYNGSILLFSPTGNHNNVWEEVVFKTRKMKAPIMIGISPETAALNMMSYYESGTRYDRPITWHNRGESSCNFYTATRSHVGNEPFMMHWTADAELT